ncbi:hypothetical protein AM1BK_39090 [Neobacillus kokaensis]|uniref:DUF5067 domain-containing protein n=2 Tax=Neobacillus kokaensis TaxID=2759023 RepID=A0ABQ3N8F3_9BACI|nr:hypothetical protein AM1BK_39090 [Neobacillus kokaensis]
MTLFAVSGCSFNSASESKKESEEKASNNQNNAPVTNPGDNSNNNNAPATPATPSPTTPSTPPAPATPPQPPAASEDPAEVYGVYGLMEDYNNLVGNKHGITMVKTKLYSEDQDYATFSITLSNGNGMGMVVVKETKKVKVFSIVSPISTDADYDKLYKSAAVLLMYIDQNVTEDVLTDILTQLGYGKPLEQINFRYESTDLEMTTEYVASSNELYFDIYYKNN